VPDVKFSPVLRWFLLILLVITLGWKVVAVQPDDYSGFEKKEADGKRKIAEFLVHQHFTAFVPEETITDLPVVRATAGPCRMLVIKSSYDGSDHDRIVRGYASATDTVFVVFGGRIYAEQPTLLTVSDFLWARFRRQLGLRVEARTVLVVIATKSCEAERLPWNELGSQHSDNINARVVWKTTA
jgi:hypothetical protein